jgi:exosortase/archaeosortase family protein
MASQAGWSGKAAARLDGPLSLRFGVGFGLIAGGLFTLYAFPWELFGARHDWLEGYLVAYAHLAGAVLGLFERGLIVDGTLIQGRFALQIVRNCDAADINIVFASALLAFPAPWLKKVPLLLGGIALLVAANVTRICSLYYVGVYAQSWFKVAHEEVWPLLLVVFTVGVFVACLQRLRPARENGSRRESESP